MLVLVRLIEIVVSASVTDAEECESLRFRSVRELIRVVLRVLCEALRRQSADPLLERPGADMRPLDVTHRPEAGSSSR